jgi:coenzyme F420-dependent glucose-6-phosphate dehydrogenase
MVLRERADGMERSEILSKYAIVADAAGLIDAYAPLVQAVGADVVSIQVASVDPDRTIDLIGREVLPELRKLAG